MISPAFYNRMKIYEYTLRCYQFTDDQVFDFVVSSIDFWEQQLDECVQVHQSIKLP